MSKPIIKLIRVTRADIKAGVRGDELRCPVALAVTRAVRNLPYFHGFYDTVLSARVADIVNAYDAGGTMKPFTTRMTLVKSLK